MKKNNAVTREQLKSLVRESSNDVVSDTVKEKKESLQTADARVDELMEILHNVKGELEEISYAIYHGEITPEVVPPGKSYVRWQTAEHMVDIVADVRTSVVDIGAVQRELNDALLDVCDGLKTNLGAFIRGKRNRN